MTITAIETGTDNRVERIKPDYHKSADDMMDHNPLGKVPAMVLNNGDMLVDSSVICAYLDSLHDGGKFELAMDWINSHPSVLEGPLNIGHISVASGIGWVEFRMSGVLGDWKTRWPTLGAWYNKVGERPSFKATIPE